MKKFKLTNKGMSIESAVVFMIVIFMFCSIITSLTLYSSYQAKTQNIYLERKIELDQIGENFVAHMKNNQNTEFSIGNDKYSKKDNSENSNNGTKILDLYYANDTSKTTILYIEYDKVSGKVIKWNYSN